MLAWVCFVVLHLSSVAFMNQPSILVQDSISLPLHILCVDHMTNTQSHALLSVLVAAQSRIEYNKVDAHRP